MGDGVWRLAWLSLCSSSRMSRRIRSIGSGVFPVCTVKPNRPYTSYPRSRACGEKGHVRFSVFLARFHNIHAAFQGREGGPHVCACC